MRCVLVLILIAISGVAIADTATRVAVIETDVKLLRKDVSDLKEQMVTKTEYQLLYDRLGEIKDLVNPKLEKVDTLTAWKDSHIRAHDSIEKGKDRSIVIAIGVVTLIFTAISIVTGLLINKRNGNRG